MFLSIPMALLLAVAAPVAEQAASTKATAIAPFLGEEVAVVVHIDLTKWNAADLPPPRPRQAGRRRRSERRHEGHRRLGRHAESGRRQGPVPAVRPGRHARSPRRGGAAGGRGRRQGDQHGSIGRRARKPAAMASQRDHPRRRRRRHACGLGPNPRRRAQSSPRVVRRAGRGR